MPCLTKKLKKEEQWSSDRCQGAGAPATKARPELQKLRAIRRDRREAAGIVKIESQGDGRSGNGWVVKADKISFSYDSIRLSLNFPRLL